MEISNHTGKIMGALLLGTAIGGVIGILFAPEKGSKTREKMLGRSNDLTDALKEKFEMFLGEIKKEAESATDKANAFIRSEEDKSARS